MPSHDQQVGAEFSCGAGYDLGRVSGIDEDLYGRPGFRLKRRRGLTMPSERNEKSPLIVRRRPPLDVFFQPRNVAVIGATEEKSSVGHSIVSNLKRTSFGGSIYPINPNRSSVFDLPCFPRISDAPGKIDLAVSVTPARTVPGIIGECAAAGVEGAIIISAGFKETGERGAILEQETLRAVGGSSDPTASAS